MWRYIKDKAGDFYRSLFRPIPEDFYSSETGLPFTSCVECNADITSEDSDYILEKGIFDDEVIYEYALCDDCCKGLRKQLSKDSLKHIRRSLKRPLLKATIDGCRICALPRHELPSHVIVGSCVGDQMLFLGVPILLCEPCLETISEGLSKETQDILDDFEERNFPGPPEMALDLPEPTRKKRRPVFL